MTYLQVKVLNISVYLSVELLDRLRPIVRRYTFFPQIFAVCRNFCFGVSLLYRASKVVTMLSSASENTILASESLVYSRYSPVVRAWLTTAYFREFIVGSDSVERVSLRMRRLLANPLVISDEVKAPTMLPVFGFGKSFSLTEVHDFGTCILKPDPEKFVRFTLSQVLDPKQLVRRKASPRVMKSVFISSKSK